MDGKMLTADNGYMISDDVIQSIVSKAALDTPGVAALAAKAGEHGGLLKNDLFVREVKVQRAADGFCIEVGLTLCMGARVQEVCELVQKNCKDALESMVTHPVGRIDVYVYGVAETK